jgi:hypothetical protein
MKEIGGEGQGPQAPAPSPNPVLVFIGPEKCVGRESEAHPAIGIRKEEQMKKIMGLGAMLLAGLLVTPGYLGGASQALAQGQGQTLTDKQYQELQRQRQEEWQDRERQEQKLQNSRQRYQDAVKRREDAVKRQKAAEKRLRELEKQGK